MTKAERAKSDLQHTDWDTMEVAGKLDVSIRIARMYLKGQRNIPSKLWPFIPASKQIYDTGYKTRSKKEKKENRKRELNECYKIKVPQLSFFSETVFFLTYKNKILPRRQMIIDCIMDRLATIRMLRYLP
jgi:hypothetical protein